MEITCPLCQSGSVMQKDKLFVCSTQTYNPETKTNEGCEFKIWKTVFGTTLTFEDVEQLCNAEQIEKECISKAGKKYTGLLNLILPDCDLKLSFPEREEKTDDNGINEFTKGYKKNGVIVWKTIAKSPITYDEALTLFDGGEITKEDFYSEKKQENFTATLTIVNEKVEMVFNN